MENILTTQTPACSSIDAFIPVRYRLSSNSVSASSKMAVISYSNSAVNTSYRDNRDERRDSEHYSYSNNNINNNINNNSNVYNYGTSSVHYANLFRLRSRSISDGTFRDNDINLRWNANKSKQDDDILTNKTIQTMRNYVILHKLSVPNGLLRSEQLLNNYTSQLNGNEANATINATAASGLTANMTGEVNKLSTSSHTLITNKIAPEGNSVEMMNVSENIKNGLIATLTGAPPTEHNASDDLDKQLMRIEEQVQLRLHGDKCDASKMYTFISLEALLQKSDKENESRSNDNTVSSVVDSNANHQASLPNTENNERVLYSEALTLLAKLIAMIKMSRTKASRASVGCVNSINLTSTKLGTIGDLYLYLQHEATLLAQQQKENLSGNVGKLSDNSNDYSSTRVHDTNEIKTNANESYLPSHTNADSLDFANHDVCKRSTELNLSTLSLEGQIAFPDIELLTVWQSPLPSSSLSSSLIWSVKLNTAKNQTVLSINASNVQKQELNTSKRMSRHDNNNSSVIYERSLCLGMIAPLLFTPGDLRYCITELVCVNCGLNDSDACALSHILRLNKDKRQATYLTTLDLRNNNITNLGAEYLKKALKYNKTILTLLLSGNDNITDKSILTSIEKRLHKNKSKHVRTEPTDNSDGTNKNKKKTWLQRLIKECEQRQVLKK